MDTAMIGKIEKAIRYANEPERITFNSLTALFRGDNSTYTISMTPEGWACTCPGYGAHGMCPHIMAMERLLGSMLKRAPMPYAPGQNVVSDVEKAIRYAAESDRIMITSFEVTFEGENGAHYVTYDNGVWGSDSSFFQKRGVSVHTMAMERVLGTMLAQPVAAV